MKTDSATVASYLAALPPERREVVATVRDAVRRRLPAGYEEAVAWGAITWQIPLARYPDTYNDQPLCYAALAAQKSHYALYLMCVHMNPAQQRALRDGYARAGRKLDMGKSCLRFKSLADLELELVVELLAGTTPEQYIAKYEEVRSGAKSGATSGGTRGGKTGTARKGGGATKTAAKSGATPPAARRAAKGPAKRDGRGDESRSAPIA